MLKNMLHRGLVTALLLTSFTVCAQSAQAASPAAPDGPTDPFIRSLSMNAQCTGSFQVFATVDITSNGNTQSADPLVFISPSGNQSPIGLAFTGTNPDGTENYVLDFAGGDNDLGYIQFTDALGVVTRTPKVTGCKVSSIRGTAFEDINGNGKRDGSEPTFGQAWYKVTDGGNWYVCGYVGNDSTFGVPVKPGTYYVIPVSLPGYRVTTPRIGTNVFGGIASLNNNIGYIKDPTAKLEGCDTYNPPSH